MFPASVHGPAAGYLVSLHAGFNTSPLKVIDTVNLRFHFNLVFYFLLENWYDSGDHGDRSRW